MVIVGDGARNFVPLRHSFGRSENFLLEPTFEMVQWYYDTDHTAVMDYESYDDKISVIHMLEYGNSYEKTRTFSIGPKEKKEICRHYFFYHPEERRIE